MYICGLGFLRMAMRLAALRPRFVAMQQLHSSRCWASAAATAQEADGSGVEQLVAADGSENAEAALKVADGDEKKKKKRSKAGVNAEIDHTAAKVTIDFRTPIREYKFPTVPNAKATGMPTTRRLFTVIRGPHIDKKSREQFDIQTRKWRIVIDTETNKLREKLDFLKEHRVLGVEISASFQYMTRLDWPLKPAALPDKDKWRMYRLREANPEVYTASKLASEFKIREQQVYHILRTMEERIKHKDLFGTSE